MPIINDEMREETRKFIGELNHPVQLVVFTQEMECQFCSETRELAEEVASVSDQISVQVYDFEADKEKADELNIDKIPAIAVLGSEDYGVRFYGIPSGYEFTSLIHAIKLAGVGQTDLSEETLQTLAELEEPVHFQVFVTPTCPYCPQAVVLAHQMAVASPKVTADMVEATEFPQLSVKYQVMGVPRTIINEDTHIEGAAPEPMVLDKLRQALSAVEG